MRGLVQLAVFVAFCLLLAACGGDDKSPHLVTPLPSSPGPAVARSTPGRAPDGPAWTVRAALPTPRAEVASAVLDGRIYIVAGVVASGDPSSVVEVYDPATDRWQRRANLPDVRDHAMAAVFGGKV